MATAVLNLSDLNTELTIDLKFIHLFNKAIILYKAINIEYYVNIETFDVFFMFILYIYEYIC